MLLWLQVFGTMIVSPRRGSLLFYLGGLIHAELSGAHESEKSRNSSLPELLNTYENTPPDPLT